MKPLTQLYTFGMPKGSVVPDEPVGDCWRTSIACILDLADPADFPHVVDESIRHEGEEGWGWWELNDAALAARGLAMSCAEITEVHGSVTIGHLFPGEGAQKTMHELYRALDLRYVVIGGPSPRGDFEHAVVGDIFEERMVHDPHPSRAMLTSITCVFYLYPKVLDGETYDAYVERLAGAGL